MIIAWLSQILADIIVLTEAWSNSRTLSCQVLGSDYEFSAAIEIRYKQSYGGLPLRSESDDY